ncbi:MAG: diguanylate cyclase [Magnetospirillum sp.]|nr:diguanylate cyclase [Magnetospirillum sp.]
MAGNVIDFPSERRQQGPRFDANMMKVLEVSRDLVCLCRNGRITAVNGAGVAMLGGRSTDEVLGCRLSDFLIPEYGPVLDLFLSGLASEDKPIPTRIVALDRSLKDVELQVFRAREIATDATVVVGRDVSHEGHLAGTAQESGARFSMLVDNAMNLVCHVRDKVIHYVNHAGAEMLGAASVQAVVGIHLADIFHDDYREVFEDEVLESVVDERQAVPMRLKRRDGTPVDVVAMITRLPSARGNELMVEARDITAHNRAVAALRRANETLEQRVVERTRELAEQRALAEARKHAADAARRFSESVIDTIPSPVWYKDGGGAYRMVNQSLRLMLGADPIHAPECGIFLPDIDAATDRELLSGSRDRVVFEAAARCYGSQPRDLLVSKTALVDVDGRPLGIIGVATDITERKAMERELRRLATTDPLTGSFNRRHFMASASRELDRSLRHDHRLSVVMLDIDHFKRINDAHGHAIGDEALKMLVNDCRDELREHDTLGRLGGEEFAVLLPETAFAAAMEAAERLRLRVAAIRVPLPDGESLSFTSSLGVAAFAGDYNVEALLARADAALYRAKASGRNRVEGAE